jgi:hypothetical protein
MNLKVLFFQVIGAGLGLRSSLVSIDHLLAFECYSIILVQLQYSLIQD